MEKDDSTKKGWLQEFFDPKFMLAIIGMLLSFYVSVYSHHHDVTIHVPETRMRELFVDKTVWEECEKNLDQRLSGIEKSLDKIDQRLNK
jgi:hypothetical protein